MTPKEKADELITRFAGYTEPSDSKHEAIQCAHIAVSEILEIGYVSCDVDSYQSYHFYKKVLHELEAYND